MIAESCVCVWGGDQDDGDVLECRHTCTRDWLCPKHRVERGNLMCFVPHISKFDAMVSDVNHP